MGPGSAGAHPGVRPRLGSRGAPVTLVYALMFAGVAIANLWALRWLLREWRHHRSDKSKQQQATA